MRRLNNCHTLNCRRSTKCPIEARGGLWCAVLYNKLLFDSRRAAAQTHLHTSTIVIVKQEKMAFITTDRKMCCFQILQKHFSPKRGSVELEVTCPKADLTILWGATPNHCDTSDCVQDMLPCDFDVLQRCHAEEFWRVNKRDLNVFPLHIFPLHGAHSPMSGGINVKPHNQDSM